jgi:ethanolaminephosphotransferase
VYPAWAWYYAAASFFAYQTLDAIDGTQARRTGTSGPLGELFDHGCDAFFTPAVQVNICIALDFAPFPCFVFASTICTGMFFTIWEQFATGTLDMGYINGPTDGILVTCGMFIATGMYGQGYWTEPMLAPLVVPLPFSLPEIVMITGRDVFTAVAMLAAAGTVFNNISHALRAPNATRTISYVLPVLILLAGYLMFIQTFPAIHKTFLYAPEFTFGITASFCATRMTICRLCKYRYEAWNKLTVVSIGFVWGMVAASCAAKTYAPELSEKVDYAAAVGICVLCVGSQLSYLHMIIAVFRQFAEFLGINILTLTEAQLAKLTTK